MADKWVFDSFCFYDHDYLDEKNSLTLYNLGYKLFGNWPYLVTGLPTRDPLSSDIRIILLGGSTSSPLLGSTWGSHLFELIASCGISHSVTLFYGGCGSYSSFNEYMKLSRDIFSLKPTHVVSLSGTNDTIVPDELSSGFVGQLVDPLTAGNLFTHYNQSFPSVYRHNRFVHETLQMNQICLAVNAKFKRFLQPTLGSIHSKFATLDKELSDMIVDIGNVLGGVQSYSESVFSFYQSLSNLDLPSCISDISDCIESKNCFWQDARHPSDKGYAKIASIIFNDLDLK